MHSRPAYSPWAPELGCADTAAKPVISARSLLTDIHAHHQLPGQSLQRGAKRGLRLADLLRLSIISRYPSVWLGGAKGCMLANSGHVTGIISEVALSFMVQDPSEIMEVLRDRSLFSSFFRYLLKESLTFISLLKSCT
jgi:hypothetical protein